MNLLSNTKVPKDHIEDILDIDPSGKTSQRLGGGSELFGNNILPPGRILS
jgi:hypothetical protein